MQSPFCGLIGTLTAVVILIATSHSALAQTLGCSGTQASCAERRTVASHEYERWEDGSAARGAGSTRAPQSDRNYFLGGHGNFYGYGR